MAYRVLITDDSPAMRSFVRRVVELSGFELSACYEAGDGAEALAVLRNEWVDAILTDINMPGVSGPDLQASLNGVASSLPVVFLTGHADIPTTMQVIKAGAEDLLTKPVAKDTLVQAIERALARRRTMRDKHE